MFIALLASSITATTTAVFALSDLVNGAIITGLFTLANTALNILMLQIARRIHTKVKQTNEQITATKEIARESADNLKELN